MCLFGRCRYKRLPFGAAPAGDMFQRKIDEIFKYLPNVLGITDDILVVGYDRYSKDHDDTLQRVLQICRQVNLKLNKDKCNFRCTQVPFIGKMIFSQDLKPYPQKLLSNEGNVLSKKQKELQAFLGIINYLRKISLRTADICEALRQLTSVKTEWNWNAAYQKLFDKAKSIIKEDVCMKFYYETKPLY